MKSKSNELSKKELTTSECCKVCHEKVSMLRKQEKNSERKKKKKKKDQEEKTEVATAETVGAPTVILPTPIIEKEDYPPGSISPQSPLTKVRGSETSSGTVKRLPTTLLMSMTRSMRNE